jgi:hypothetical protein
MGDFFHIKLACDIGRSHQDENQGSAPELHESVVLSLQHKTEIHLFVFSGHFLGAGAARGDYSEAKQYRAIRYL